MVLSEYARTLPGFRFGLLATDICTSVLDKAAMGIFKSELVAPVPKDLLRKYFMRSRDPESDLLRVVPEIRCLIEFRRLNFMDADFGLTEPAGNHLLPQRHHLFRPADTVRLLEKLTRHLAPGGYFFAGHSEYSPGHGPAADPRALRRPIGKSDGPSQIVGSARTLIFNRGNCTSRAAPQSCGPSWDRVWASPSTAPAWAPAPCATAFCRGAPSSGLRVPVPLEGHRYVDFSIHYLAREFDALGARRKELEVKLFGGADVLPVSGTRGEKPTIGALNCAAALEVLEEEGFRSLRRTWGEPADEEFTFTPARDKSCSTACPTRTVRIA